jgi:hypothetical protein
MAVLHLDLGKSRKHKKIRSLWRIFLNGKAD